MPGHARKEVNTCVSWHPCPLCVDRSIPIRKETIVSPKEKAPEGAKAESPPAKGKAKKPKEKKKPEGPPKPTVFGHPVSAVARALGQQTEVKAKVVAQFIVSKGIEVKEDTVTRQCLRARRALDPTYEGCGEGGYYKLGEVPTLSEEQLAEFSMFVEALPPPPEKKPKKEKKEDEKPPSK